MLARQLLFVDIFVCCCDRFLDDFAVHALLFQVCDNPKFAKLLVGFAVGGVLRGKIGVVQVFLIFKLPDDGFVGRASRARRTMFVAFSALESGQPSFAAFAWA